jgi:hypothetical protein
MKKLCLKQSAVHNKIIIGYFDCYFDIFIFQFSLKLVEKGDSPIDDLRKCVTYFLLFLAHKHTKKCYFEHYTPVFKG